MTILLVIKTNAGQFGDNVAVGTYEEINFCRRTIGSVVRELTVGR